MKNKKRLSILLAIFFIFSLNARGQIITIKESDQDGHEYINKNISDINSLLKIAIDISKLQDLLMKKNIGNFPKELLETIEWINEVLADRQKSLDHANQAIELYKQGEYDAYLKEIGDASMVPASLLKNQRIRNVYYEMQRDKSYSNPLIYVFESAEKVVSELITELKEKTRENGVCIQMGSWLITEGEKRQIHLPGFDNIDELSPYIVPRWMFSPTDEEKKKFARLNNLAKENKEDGIKLIQAVVKTYVDKFSDLLKTELQNEILIFIDLFENEINSLAGNNKIEALKVDIEKVRSESKEYLEFIRETIKKYKESKIGSADDFFSIIEKVKTDAEKITSKFNSLKEQFEKIINNLSGLSSDLKGKTTKLMSEISENVMGQISKIIDGCNPNRKGNLIGVLSGEKFDATSLEFSEEVYKLDITNCPESTEIQLEKTGPRENGDRFIVKITAESAISQKPEIVETFQLDLFQVLPHVRTLAGLIFAKSIGQGEAKANFKISPSYNVLFKGFWDKKIRRNSILYNRIWDFCFGINIAAMDFNNDDTQELGIGFVFSGVMDYLQYGVGYNVMAKKPYWFFGLRLPILSAINL